VRGNSRAKDGLVVTIQKAEMVEIARDQSGYVLPIAEQPWFDGHQTPDECLMAWNAADAEDWARFDRHLRAERAAQAAFDARWGGLIFLVPVALTALAVWAMVSILGITQR